MVLYAASGAAGLVYEVAWGRRLALVLGSSAVSAAVVLSAFLGALGLGAGLGGRLADRSASPLRVYGLLEIAAAAWALVVPFLVPAVEALYVRGASGLTSGARIPLAFVAALAVVGPGALALGATFPCVLRAFVGRPSALGRVSGLLYGVNTLGAVAGALWAGFFGIAAHGLAGTARIAAFVALAVGVVALAIARRPAVGPGGGFAADSDGAPAPRAALAAAAFSGLLALGLEAAGFRILVFFVEGFTASFAAMLGVFLAGLAVGSLLFAPLLARFLRPSTSYGLLLLATGGATLALCAAIPSFEAVLRGVRDQASRSGDVVAALRRTALAGSFLLFFVPAALLGASYPSCVRWAGGTDLRGVGRRIGAVALWNAVGAVLGPILVLGLGLWSGGGSGDRPGGPLFAWTFLGLAALAVGTVVVVAAFRHVRLLVPVAGVAAGLALGFGAPTLLVRATPRALVEDSRVVRDARGRFDPRKSLLEVRSDETTTASVVELPTGERILYTDEFAAAATGSSYPYMRMLGHLPVILARDPRNALVIAFGTGTTAGAVAATSTVERLEIVETSRAVYGLAPRFEAANRGVLSDRRVVRRVDDGRHALLLHAPDLDVITLEPLMPYTPAALPFYTREFYELARDRLRDGGVLCQWVPVHAMRPDLYGALLRAFFETFPDGSLWFFEQSTVLVGRKGTDGPDADDVRARTAELQRDLNVAGMRAGWALGAAYVASGRRVLAVLDDPSKSGQEAWRGANLGPLASRAVTDDDPFPEAFPAPRANVATTYAASTLGWLAGVVDPNDDGSANPLAALFEPGMSSTGRDALVDAIAGRSAEADGDFRSAVARDAESLADARGRYEAAVRAYTRSNAALQGTDVAVDIRRIRLSRRMLALATRDRLAAADVAARGGDRRAEDAALEAAIATARKAYEIEPFQPVLTERPEAAALLVEALARAGRCAEALEFLVLARGSWPRASALSDVAEWLSARKAGRDPASAGVDPSVVARLLGARPCSDELAGRARGYLRVLHEKLLVADAVGFRATAEMMLAAFKPGDPARAEAARDLLDHAELLPPGVDAERASLLAVLVPGDGHLAALLRSTDGAVRRAALLAAARRGFEATGSTALVRDEFVRATDPARRVEYAEVALADPSAEVRSLVVDLLGDPEPTVRAAAWASAAALLPAASRTSVAYDPAGPDADRPAAVERVRAALRKP